MKKLMVLICMIVVGLMFSMQAFATSQDSIMVSAYVTTKDDVPVWTQPTSTGDSRVLCQIDKKDSVVLIDSYTINSYGNVWGALYDGAGYIYISSKNGETGNLKIVNDSTESQQYIDETDYCQVCDEIVWHQAALELSFVTLKNDVPIWSEPRSSSNKIDVISTVNSPVSIVARAQNEYGNHWGKTSDGYYVYMENLAFDLDNHLNSSCDVLNETFFPISTFYNNVKRGGVWDLKISLNPTRDYYVYLDGKIQDSTMTGEDIGNFHYGYVGRTVFPKEVLLLGGGMENMLENGFSYSSCFGGDWCDSEVDTKMVKKGIDYFEDKM